jgi:hypothetical protein
MKIAYSSFNAMRQSFKKNDYSYREDILYGQWIDEASEFIVFFPNGKMENIINGPRILKNQMGNYHE